MNKYLYNINYVNNMFKNMMEKMSIIYKQCIYIDRIYFKTELIY
jgi:hypothetical protein